MRSKPIFFREHQFLSKHQNFMAHFNPFHGTCCGTQFGKPCSINVIKQVYIYRQMSHDDQSTSECRTQLESSRENISLECARMKMFVPSYTSTSDNKVHTRSCIKRK